MRPSCSSRGECAQVTQRGPRIAPCQSVALGLFLDAFSCPVLAAGVFQMALRFQYRWTLGYFFPIVENVSAIPKPRGSGRGVV